MFEFFHDKEKDEHNVNIVGKDGEIILNLQGFKSKGEAESFLSNLSAALIEGFRKL